MADEIWESREILLENISIGDARNRMEQCRLIQSYEVFT